MDHQTDAPPKPGSPEWDRELGGLIVRGFADMLQLAAGRVPLRLRRRVERAREAST